MTKITAAHSMSLDGFIDSPRVHDWLHAGDTPSRVNPAFTMSALSARFFDEGVLRCGAVIAGRRTYDVSEAWGGRGPMPPLPLFVVTHRVPGTVPPSEPPYTFITTGIEDAVQQARAAAASKDVVLMGASIVQQCLNTSLLDELIISLVPMVLGHGTRLLDNLAPGSPDLSLAGVVDAPGVTHLTYQIVKQRRARARPAQKNGEPR
jgi:dihydrofolate reductase